MKTFLVPVELNGRQLALVKRFAKAGKRITVEDALETIVRVVLEFDSTWDVVECSIMQEEEAS